MPELPEVETLCRQMRQTITDARINGLVVLDDKLQAPSGIAGHHVQSIIRRGKFLLIGLEDGRTLYLHLRMSGRLLWKNHRDPLPAYTRFTIAFAQGRLIGIDPRRFATLAIEDGKNRTAVIPDPLKAFPAKLLWKAAQGRKAPVKSFLLDQRMVAGIGNIYACEMLYRAGISPWRSAGDLSLDDWQTLARAGRNVLLKATACRGTSVSDWLDLYGRKGEYQHCLKVYGRKGEPCFGCGRKVQRSPLGGRGTYYCPVCQS